MVKKTPTNVGDIRDQVPSLGREDPLEEKKATHSSILAWRIPRTEESRGLQYICHRSEVKVTQSCLTLCAPMNCSRPGSSVHGIFQARILEWVAFSSSRGSS